MTNVFVDDSLRDDERRARLYSGDLLVRTGSKAVRDFVAFTKGLVEEAFPGRSPETAQYELPVEEFAQILAELKPRFIHHPESKRHLASILTEQGCDPDQTYFDVPRLRTSTSDDYLTTGIAYAFHPHRDTWYSAPMMQINWWLPIYEVCPENALAFHPRYFDQPVKNGSEQYNYYLWNRDSRHNAANQIGVDTRVQPKPLEPVELDPQIRPIPPVGGMTLFSGAQLHSSVPNSSGRTRYSVDFRTVHRLDVEQLGGARNIDSRSTGTSLRDFMRVSDLTRLPDDVIAPYDKGVSKEVLKYATASN